MIRALTGPLLMNSDRRMIGIRPGEVNTKCTQHQSVESVNYVVALPGVVQD